MRNVVRVILFFTIIGCNKTSLQNKLNVYKCKEVKSSLKEKIFIFQEDEINYLEECQYEDEEVKREEKEMKEEENKEIKARQEKIIQQQKLEKENEEREKNYIMLINSIDSKIKQLGFVNGFFKYQKGCSSYVKNNGIFFSSPLKYATIHDMYYAIKNCNLTIKEAKKYLIIQPGNIFFNFELTNYDKDYGYYTDRNSGMSVVLKKKKKVPEYNLSEVYLKLIGLTKVQKILGPVIEVLFFEEVKFSKKDKQWLSSQIEKDYKYEESFSY